MQEICDNQDISGLIALPIEVWHFIASYLSIEEYFNPNFSTRDDDVLLVKDAHLDLNLDV